MPAKADKKHIGSAARYAHLLPAHLPRERVVVPAPCTRPVCGGRLAKPDNAREMHLPVSRENHSTAGTVVMSPWRSSFAAVKRRSYGICRAEGIEVPDLADVTDQVGSSSCDATLSSSAWARSPRKRKGLSVPRQWKVIRNTRLNWAVPCRGKRSPQNWNRHVERSDVDLTPRWRERSLKHSVPSEWDNGSRRLTPSTHLFPRHSGTGPNLPMFSRRGLFCRPALSPRAARPVGNFAWQPRRSRGS
jgi:hypothetical protein